MKPEDCKAPKGLAVSNPNEKVNVTSQGEPRPWMWGRDLKTSTPGQESRLSSSSLAAMSRLYVRRMKTSTKSTWSHAYKTGLGVGGLLVFCSPLHNQGHGLGHRLPSPSQAACSARRVHHPEKHTAQGWNHWCNPLPALTGRPVTCQSCTALLCLTPHLAPSLPPSGPLCLLRVCVCWGQGESVSQYIWGQRQ